MCQLVSNGAFLKTTKLKNRPIKISLRFAVWSQFYQQPLINKEIKLFWIFPSHKAGLVQTEKKYLSDLLLPTRKNKHNFSNFS